MKIAQSCPTLCNPWTVACQIPLSMEFSRQDTRVGSHSFLQGIFLVQGLNLGLLHCRQILYHLNHQWRWLLCIQCFLFYAFKALSAPWICMSRHACCFRPRGSSAFLSQDLFVHLQTSTIPFQEIFFFGINFFFLIYFFCNGDSECRVCHLESHSRWPWGPISRHSAISNLVWGQSCELLEFWENSLNF